MPETRRRIDQVLDSGFLGDLDSLDLDELRARRRMADEVENELSYYRRLLHGRLDLLGFEQRRRSGVETRTLIEALPEILSSGETPSPSRGRHIVTDLPLLPDVGRRDIDHLLGDDVLTRLDRLGEADIQAAIESLTQAESEISDRRRRVQSVVDALVAAIADRYRESRASSDA